MPGIALETRPARLSSIFAAKLSGSRSRAAHSVGDMSTRRRNWLRKRSEKSMIWQRPTSVDAVTGASRRFAASKSQILLLQEIRTVHAKALEQLH